MSSAIHAVINNSDLLAHISAECGRRQCQSNQLQSLAIKI